MTSVIAAQQCVWLETEGEAAGWRPGVPGWSRRGAFHARFFAALQPDSPLGFPGGHAGHRLMRCNWTIRRLVRAVMLSPGCPSRARDARRRGGHARIRHREPVVVAGQLRHQAARPGITGLGRERPLGEIRYIILDARHEKMRDGEVGQKTIRGIVFPTNVPSAIRCLTTKDSAVGLSTTPRRPSDSVMSIRCARGGTPVRSPTADGFGTAVIERRGKHQFSADAKAKRAVGKSDHSVCGLTGMIWAMTRKSRLAVW